MLALKGQITHSNLYVDLVKLRVLKVKRVKCHTSGFKRERCLLEDKLKVFISFSSSCLFSPTVLVQLCPRFGTRVKW